MDLRQKLGKTYNVNDLVNVFIFKNVGLMQKCCSENYLQEGFYSRSQ